MTQRVHAFELGPQPAARRYRNRYTALWVPTALLATALATWTAAALAQPGPIATKPVSTDDAGRNSKEPRDPAEEVQKAVERLFDEPLGGVVVNRTVTVLGKDFYRYFANYWRYTDQAGRYSISIHERPTARFGSEIWVLYRQQRIFHTFLPPARAATRELSQLAVEQVRERIAQRELERFTAPDPDLGSEEL